MKSSIILALVIFFSTNMYAQDETALSQRAEKYYLNYQYKKLSAVADTFLKIDKKHPYYHFLKATALNDTPFRAVLDKKTYNKIISHFDKAIKYSDGKMV